MKIKYGSVFGNYKWTKTVELTDEQLALLAPFGALNIDQRTPSSNAEKEMEGYTKRPKDFKRTDIPFDAKKAETLKKHLQTLSIPNGKNGNGETVYVNVPAESVEVEQYFGSEVDVKMTDERNAYARNAEAGKLAQLAKRVGYAGDVGSGAAAEAPVEFLRAIRTWSKEMVKGL